MSTARASSFFISLSITTNSKPWYRPCTGSNLGPCLLCLRGSWRKRSWPSQTRRKVQAARSAIATSRTRRHSCCIAGRAFSSSRKRWPSRGFSTLAGPLRLPPGRQGPRDRRILRPLPRHRRGSDGVLSRQHVGGSAQRADSRKARQPRGFLPLAARQAQVPSGPAAMHASPA